MCNSATATEGVDGGTKLGVEGVLCNGKSACGFGRRVCDIKSL